MLKRISMVSMMFLVIVLASCSSSHATSSTSAGTHTPKAGPSSGATATPTARPSLIPNFSHIFLILMENQNADGVLGNSAAPYINSLAQQYSKAANYFGITHPSLPNYLELLGGSTFGVSSDCTDCFVSATNLVDQLEAAHKSWKAYMEDMPSPCFVGNAGGYAQRHNPFIYFDDIRNNAARCANIVPLSDLSSDLAGNQLPDFIWITPNVCHDMHDCGISAGDAWLKGFLPQILNSPSWQSSALFLLWDEGEGTNAGCCQIAHGGNVPMLVISPLSKPGFTSSVNYDHASMLLTIEEAWGLGKLGDAACSCTTAMTDFFSGS